MQKRKMILVSIDSFVGSDLNIMRQFPNFRYLLDRSSVVYSNLTTYPSYTHSIHASISTGCYPGTHGIISNEHSEPGNLSPAWFESYKDVKVPTLAQEARRHGYTVAEVYWPLTLGDEAEWNIHRAGIHVIPDNEQEVIRQRSKPGFFDEVYPYIKDAFTLPRDFKSDEVCFDTAEYLIDRHQPDFMEIHLIIIDNYRHHYGVYSKHLHEAYAYLDKGFGRMLDALRRQGLEEETIWAVTADHGHLDIRQIVSINRFFRDHGLIEVDEKGNLVSWKAWLQTCSLSGHVYIKDNDPAIAREVYELLQAHREELEIERIFTKEEVEKEWHLTGDFTYVIESFGGSSFSSNYNWELYTSTDNKTYQTSKATHGHLPYKGVQPCFFLRNPFSDKQVYVPEGRIIDQAPTLAKLLGFEMTTCDGQPMEALLV